jgi:peptide/nickel transport system permease protein
MQLMGGIAIILVMLKIIPYDPTVFFLFSFIGSDAERAYRLQLLRESLGLDLPIHIQFVNYLKLIFIDQSLGISWTYNMDVSELISNALPNTMITFGFAFLIYTPLAFFLGIISATKRAGLLDNVVRVLTTATYSIPSYILGLWILLYIGSFSGGIWPRPLPEGFFQLFRYSIYPIIVVVLGYTGFQFRLVRRHMLEILRENYIKTARAKGLPERTVIYKHALRNALPAFITTIAVTFPISFSGVAALELLFNIPGIGTLLVQSALAFDWPVLTGTTVVFIAFNAIILGFTDILAYSLSPKVWHGQGYHDLYS